MTESLDYFRPKRVRYVESVEEVRWRLRRWGYYLLQVVVFAFLVWKPLPNLFLFGSVMSPTPEQYAAEATEYAPMVAGLKAFQRDTGHLPGDTRGLPPAYQPSGTQRHWGSIDGANSVTFPVGKETVLEYVFSKGAEGWWAYGPRYEGRIPGAAVEPLSAAATQSAATRVNGGPK